MLTAAHTAFKHPMLPAREWKVGSTTRPMCPIRWPVLLLIKAIPLNHRLVVAHVEGFCVRGAVVCRTQSCDHCLEVIIHMQGMYTPELTQGQL